MEEMKSKFYEITVKDPHHGEEITIKMTWDADAWDWQRVFKQIMQWATFMPETYGEIFTLTDDELMAKEEKDKELTENNDELMGG